MSDPLPAPIRWMTSWWMDAIFLLIGIFFAWEVLATGYPWAVLAWPGLLLFFAIWHIITKLFRVPKGGPWLVNTFPLLAFAVCSSAVLFGLATHDGEYLRPAYFSLSWVILMSLASLLHLLPKRDEESDGKAPHEQKAS